MHGYHTALTPPATRWSNRVGWTNRSIYLVSPMEDMPFPSGIATTEFVETPSGRLAFRRFGERGGRPIVLFHRFRGTIDH